MNRPAVVRVTKKGQATIPIELRKKFNIKAPGLVRFVEKRGELVVEPIATVAEMRGVLKRAFEGTSGSAMLLEDRQRDLEHERRKFGT